MREYLHNWSEDRLFQQENTSIKGKIDTCDFIKIMLLTVQERKKHDKIQISINTFSFH